MNEKSQYEDELKKARDIMKMRMQGILLQCKYLILLVSTPKRAADFVSIIGQNLSQGNYFEE